MAIDFAVVRRIIRSVPYPATGDDVERALMTSSESDETRQLAHILASRHREPFRAYDEVVNLAEGIIADQGWETRAA